MGKKVQTIPLVSQLQAMIYGIIEGGTISGRYDQPMGPYDAPQPII